MTCAVTRVLRETEDQHRDILAAKVSLHSCAVCGQDMRDKAVVGREEALCIGREDSCFAWFSGYPWVLFEMGRLTSDLRDYALEIS